MYESRKYPPLPRLHFLRCLALHAAGATALLLGSLAIGMAGYGYLDDLPWRDGFLNSAVLLAGMGPVDAPRTERGKVFAELYALYAGLVFIVAAGLLFVPVLHRLLHKFHWDQGQSQSGPSPMAMKGIVRGRDCLPLHLHQGGIMNAELHANHGAVEACALGNRRAIGRRRV